MDRKTTFVFALVYLAAILVLGLLFFVKRSFLFFVPDAFGPVPVGVPWFGALGAVLISLTGVFEHEHDWDPSYWPWHVARPLIGVALGVVSVLILQAGVLAVGSTPIPGSASQGQQNQPTSAPASPAATPTPTSPAATLTPTSSTATPTPTSPAATPTPTSPTATLTPTSSTAPRTAPVPTPQNQPTSAPVPHNLLYYLIAFLVGYREETFRELIKRLVDIILTPGDGSVRAPTIHGVDPAQVHHGTPTQVIITGTGFTGTQSVRFGNSAAQFTVNADGKLTATTPALPAGGAVPLTITTKSGSATSQFTFT